MHEQHVENIVATEFNLQEAKKKLRTLQETQVSQESDLSTPKVSGDASKTDSYAGKSLANILMVELYAGSARLSKACQQVGVRSIAVDKTTQRAQGNRIFVCDVTDEAELGMLRSFLGAEQDNLAWVHFAPACGTASRAREKPNRNLEKAGFRVPKPCRSDEFPLGLPHLTGTDKVRTEAANHVYKITAELIRQLHAWGVACTIENPTNSLFWKVPYIADLVQDIGGYDVIFDSCCHGGARKKSTKFWCTVPWFTSLAATCPGPGQHVHKSWTPSIVDGNVQYPTAEEAAYPNLLCQRLAECFRSAMLQLGAVDVEDLMQQQQAEQPSLHRIILDALARGKKFKPLVSEYGTYITVLHDSHVQEQEFSLPAGAKLVHQRLAKRGEVRVDGAVFHKSVASFSEEQVVTVSQFGIPRSPEDFCNRAVKCGHPRGMSLHLPEVVTQVLRDNLEMEPAELALVRCRQLARWAVRAKQLGEAEKQFKQNMPEHLQVLLQNKRLLLLREMLEELDYPDKDLVKDISVGFKLTGWQEKTGVFPPCVKRPQFSVDTLKKLAKGLNRSIISQLSAENDEDEIVRQTWDKTLEEVALGYIWLDDNSSPDQVFLAKRFGLLQRAGKLRVIDDCSIGGVNGALGVVEKYKVHAIDETAAFLTWMLQFSQKGIELEGMSGRTYDMKHAYKQYGIAEADRKLVRLAVRNPVDHTVALFGINSLPFGASGSVGGFLRISLAVWYIGLVMFRLAWTAYFDDYTVFCRDMLISNTSKTVDNLFDLLGIEVAREGSKATGFSKQFKSLGVELDLRDFCRAEARIGHTSERREEIGAVLDDILRASCVTAKQAESLRGRLHWFESFAFGRVANGAVKTLGDLSLRGLKQIVLRPREIRDLCFLRDRVLQAPPLKLTPTCLMSWVVFTDGACEGPDGAKTGSIGGVLVCPRGTLVQFFGGTVPVDLMELLLSKSKNPIYELEVMPILVAVLLWGATCEHAQVCWYLDNEAGKSAFLKAYGATEVADGMVQDFTRHEMELQIKSWFSRVPSASNIADAPSRLEDSLMRDRGALKVAISWQAIREVIVCWVSRNGGDDGNRL
jgi:hypothetical protein